jgi:hypothetical protein
MVRLLRRKDTLFPLENHHNLEDNELIKVVLLFAYQRVEPIGMLISPAKP